MRNAQTYPKDYMTILNKKQTEQAIAKIKTFFQTNLAFELNLTRVTAPLFVKSNTGINDDLNGTEQPVHFKVKDLPKEDYEIVQSLAKWKRMALADLCFKEHEGLYADMNAIRPDDTLDNLHSIYVDQWDWECIIASKERTLSTLKAYAEKIYDIIRRTEKYISYQYPKLTPFLPEKIHFIHTEELEDNYPDLSPDQREYEICKHHKAVFLIGIGGPLKHGAYHDGRAPDYDDWITQTTNGYHGLNGDILVYNPLLDINYELSSMGIRVNKDTLLQQLKHRNCQSRQHLEFHQRLLKGELPQTIGGGIGQSRLCMLYLQKAHIGEIQASIWPEPMKNHCKKHNIPLL